MVSAERERASDIYDPKYDGDEDDLRPLERGGMSLKMGDSGSDYEDKYPYSRINALQAEIKFAALYNFIKDYLPRAHKTKILFNGLGQGDAWLDLSSKVGSGHLTLSLFFS